MLGLAEHPARGTGFWSQNTEGVARGVLTGKARPEIKTYYSMSLHCNKAIREVSKPYDYGYDCV